MSMAGIVRARDVGVGQPLGRAVVALETRWKASHMDCGTQANLYQRRTFIHLSVCKFQNRCNERPLSAEVAIFLNGSDGQSFILGVLQCSTVLTGPHPPDDVAVMVGPFFGLPTVHMSQILNSSGGSQRMNLYTLSASKFQKSTPQELDPNPVNNDFFESGRE